MIADSLKLNTLLTILDLSNSNIGLSGVLKIADALKLNTSRTTLAFEFNNIGDSGTLMIADALKLNNSLTNLYLGGKYFPLIHYT